MDLIETKIRETQVRNAKRENDIFCFSSFLMFLTM